MAANAARHPLMSDLAAVVARLREITVELRTTGRAGGSGQWGVDSLTVLPIVAAMRFLVVLPVVRYPGRAINL